MKQAFLSLVTVALAALGAAGCGDDAARAPSSAAPAPRVATPKTVVSPAKQPAAPRGRGRISFDVTRDGKPTEARVSLTEGPRTVQSEPHWFSDELRPPDEATDVPAAAATPGLYVADGLPPGTYTVVATASDGARAGAHVRLASAGERRTVALRLAPPTPTSALRGRVVGADGKPFGGLVSVATIDRLGPDTSDDDWHRVADDGTFALTAPAQARVAVAALIPGRLRVFGPTVSMPQAEPYLLDLSHGYDRVAVHVFDEETGNPIVGAAVGACCGRSTTLASERTDAEGRCSLLVGPGERTLYVVAAGHPGVGDVTLGPTDRAAEIPLRAGPTVRVHVVRAADGQPVAGVPVYVQAYGADGASGDAPPVRSGPDGIATFADRRPGDVLVFAMGAGWFAEGLELGRVVGGATSVNNRRPRRAPTTLPKSGTVDVEVRVVPAAVAVGVVRANDGTAVAGALVAARPTSMTAYLGHTEGGDFDSFPAPTTLTGPDGAFRLEGLFPSARYVLVATAEGQPGNARQSIDASAPGEIALRFGAPNFAELVVVDRATNAPVAGARVECLERAASGSWASRDVVAEATTDAAGVARIGPLVNGAYSASAIAPAHLRCEVQPFDATDGAPAPHLTLRLDASALIRGRVTLPGGLAPASGVATVVDDDHEGRRGGARWPEDPSYEGAISPDGTFEISDVAPGAHTVHAAVESGGRHFEGQTQAQTGDAIAIALEPAESPEEQQQFKAPASFAVRVLGPDGKPVGSASILASWTESGLSQQTTFSATRGVARIPLASRGTQVTVSGAQSMNGIGLDAGSLSIRIPEDAADGYELRLPPGASIAGRVEDDVGRPVAGVPVRAFEHKGPDQPFAWSRGEPLATAVSATDGTFELRPLDRAAYDVAVEAPFDFEPPDDLTVHGGDAGVALRMVRGTASVVVVVDPEGKPVADARVEVRKSDLGMNDELAAAETGPDGRATLPALRSGRPFRLSVNSWGHDLDPWEGSWSPAPEYVVRLKRIGVVSGRVVLPDGSTAGAVSVWLREAAEQHERDDWRRAIADANGAFVFRGVNAPSVELVAGDYDAWEGGFKSAPRLEVDPSVIADVVTPATTGATDVVLKLVADRIVRVRLEGLHGPLADADRPRLAWGDQYPLRSVATSDPSVVLFSGVAPGRDYTVVARIPVQNLVGRRAGVHAGQSVALTLEPGATLEGRVVLPAGADWDSLNVSFDGGGLSVRYESGKDARVLIPCLPRVEGDLHVWTYPQCPPERPGYSATLRVTPGTAVEIKLTKEQ